MKCLPLLKSRSTQYGLTLVELLVAMALGLLIIAGIGQIYLAAKHSYEIQNRLARIQDAGRYVTELLTEDIRRAGYWGVINNIQTASLNPLILPSPFCVSSSIDWGRMVREKIFGLNDTSGAYFCINRLRGDVLTVRYGDAASVTPYNCTQCTGLYIRSTPFTGTIGFGPAGSVTSQPTSDHELVAHAYYVATSGTARECGSSSGPFLPALNREHLITASGTNTGKPQAEELVTGVEQLQFQFGVDTDADGWVNQYMNANAIANWLNVRSVRFWVLVRDDCPDSGYTDPNSYVMGDVSYTPNDGFHRALYTSTVALRNN